MIEKVTNQVVGHCGIIDKDVEGRTEFELIYVLAKFVWGKDMPLPSEIVLSSILA